MTASLTAPPEDFMDSSRLRDLGWEPRIELVEGVAQTCTWYRSTLEGNGDV